MLSIGAVASAYATAAFTQSPAITIPIEKMDVGRPPADFEFWRTGQGGAARWIIVEDSTADGGRAVEQVSTDKTDYRFPLAIYKPIPNALVMSDLHDLRQQGIGLKLVHKGAR